LRKRRWACIGLSMIVLVVVAAITAFSRWYTTTSLYYASPVDMAQERRKQDYGETLTVILGDDWQPEKLTVRYRQRSKAGDWDLLTNSVGNVLEKIDRNAGRRWSSIVITKGMPFSDVISLLGPPDQSTSHDQQEDLTVTYYLGDLRQVPVEFIFLQGRKGRLDSIRVLPPNPVW